MARKAIYTEENVHDLIDNGRDWNFHDEETKEHLHTLHPYPAKFIPQIPRKAIESWSKIGDVVYDPFCGCGTTLLEASLLNRISIGTDNNDVAVLISKAKTTNYSESDINNLYAFISEVRENLSKLSPRKELIPNNKNFFYWFSDEVLEKLSSLKGMILEKPEKIQILLMAVFSSIIVRVSYQDSDTRYAKINRIINTGDIEKLFISKLTEVIDSLKILKTKSKRGRVSVYKSDSRKVKFIKTSSISLIVTSPPYLNAYDYHKYHRQRIHWIDGDFEFARDLEIGSHDEFTRPLAKPDQYFIDMGECFAEWSRVLKSNGFCFIVIGDSIVSKQPVCVADTFVDQMTGREFVLEDRWIRELQATKRSFNVKNSRISHEHLLLFKRK